MEQEMKEIEAKEDERSVVDVWIWAFERYRRALPAIRQLPSHI